MEGDFARSAALLDTLYATAPVGLAFFDAELRFVRINDALAAMTGRSVEAHLGRSLDELFGADAAGAVERLRHVLRTGEPVTYVEIVSRERAFRASYTPVLRAGELLGVSTVVIEVTEQQALRARERAALERASFLARAGTVLDATLNYDANLRTLAALAVPQLGDWCTVRLLQSDGSLRAVAIAHGDPEKVALAWEVERRFPVRPGADDSGPGRVVRTGETEVVNAIPRAALDAVPDPWQREALTRLAPRAYVATPLSARGRRLGVLSLSRTEHTARFSAEDVELAEELGRRAGLSLDNARLYTERTRIAHTLQARLLPERLPAIPGMELAARYRPVAGGSEVGGDFYDVVELDRGRWLAMVGDVCGKGVEAAALSGFARAAIGAIALRTSAVDEVLELANRAIRRQDGTDLYATAVVATLCKEGNVVVATLGSAGHPPALVLRSTGEVEAVEAPGLMLGVEDALGVEPRTVRLRAGDVLVLHTDGITDGRVDGERFGEARLRATLAAAAGRSAEQVVQVLGDAVEAWRPGAATDDEAILAVRVAP